MLPQDDRRHAFKHGDVDFLSFACPQAVEEPLRPQRELQPHQAVREDHRRVLRLHRPGLQAQRRNLTSPESGHHMRVGPHMALAG